MKYVFGWLPVILLLLSCPIYAQEQDYLKKKIDVAYDNAMMKDILADLTRKSGIEFLYNQDEVKQVKAQTFTMKQVTVTGVLDTCFKGTNLGYKFVDGTIVITVNKTPVTVNMIKITGKVTTSKGEILPGATVTLKGTTIGVAADINGKYELNVADTKDRVLVVSFLGMKAKEIKILPDKTVYDVMLEEENVEMEDVVVTGYANIKKSSFTGSAVRVDKDEILKVASTNVIDVLQVFDPSLRIMKNNNMGSDPNTLPEFYIRGRSGTKNIKELDEVEMLSSDDVSEFALKNNPSTPVFILDGYEVNVQKIYDLDVNRIQSVTILKDAAATAIYGSRASNGVVVIETVVPAPGKLRVSYNGNLAITAPDLSDYNLMNAKEKLEAEVLAGIFEYEGNGNETPDKQYRYEHSTAYLDKLNKITRGVDTYWLALPLKTETNHRHSVYVEGGSEDIRFGVELRYDNQNGVMKDSYRNRVGAALNLDYRYKGLQVRNQVSIDVVKAKDSPYGVFSDYTNKQPYDEYKDENGNYVELLPQWSRGGLTPKNPLYEAQLGNFSKNGYKEFVNNLTLNWYINDYLLVKGQFAMTLNLADTEKFTDPLSGTFKDKSVLEKGTLLLSDTKTNSWNTNVFVAYTRAINQHSLNFSIGMNARQSKMEYTSSSYRGFPSADLHSVGYAKEIVMKPSTTDNNSRLFGSFLLLNYSFKNIYLFDVSARFDGSSEFGSSNKWAPFWSFGAGLNLHNYALLEKCDIINQLRVKASYGQTGKVNFGPYEAQNAYQIKFDDYYTTGLGASLIQLGNKDLSWEKCNTLNVGLDMLLLENSISLQFAWYNKKTIDMLESVSIPSSSGFKTYKDNLGEVLNRGIEVDINVQAYRSKTMDVALFLRMAHNKNKLLKVAESLQEYNERVDDYFSQYNYNDAKYAKPFMKYEEGSSLTAIYGMKSLGINPADGKEVYVKRDGTVTDTWSSTEQQRLGDTEPDLQGSFGFNFRYKGFTLYTTFLFELGGEAYNNTLANVENVNLDYYNADRRVLTQRWIKLGDKTPLKNIRDRLYVTRPTSRFVQKNNNLTFNSLTLGYDFPVKLVQKVGLNMLRLQFNMKDVATISSIKQERGLSYPFARTFNFVLNASF